MIACVRSVHQRFATPIALISDAVVAEAARKEEEEGEGAPTTAMAMGRRAVGLLRCPPEAEEKEKEKIGKVVKEWVEKLCLCTGLTRAEVAALSGLTEAQLKCAVQPDRVSNEQWRAAFLTSSTQDIAVGSDTWAAEAMCALLESLYTKMS